MKVGILTYHNAINYGAILQAYALQQVLFGMGVQCEIINYACPAVEKQYRRKKLSEHAHWKVYVMDFFSGHRLDKKKVAFKQFSDTYLTLSNKVDNFLVEGFDKYDAVITGSDQVFNPKNTEGDSAYLLDFQCRAKKIAYAASIGNNDFLKLWEEQYNVDYKTLLKDFCNISFREEEASAFATQLFGKNYETVLDPVLLAGNKLWQRFQGEKKEEYIFVYNLGNLPVMRDCIQKMHEETGLKVYVVNKDIKGDVMFRKYENVSSLSPEDFVKMLSGATYVVTDSFHGTAFSALFHKNFYSVINSRKVNTNSRIRNLLKKLNLESRIVSHVEDFHYDKISTFDDVDTKIQKMQNKSLNWLSDALELQKEVNR